MNNRIIIVIVFLSSLMLQSCFEIREIVKFNKDGSGTFTMTIDMSEVKQMLAGFGGSEEIESSSPFQNMETESAATMKRLRETDGLSNINFISENDGYVIITSFDFSDIDALNRGMDVVYDNESEYEGTPDYYKFRRRKFERTSSHNFLDKVKKEFTTEDMATEGMDLSALFADVVYVNKIIFEGKKIKKVRSGHPELSENGSMATNRYLIFNEENEQSLDFKLRVK
ncbi:MAG: hypothetical protein WD052_01040 [Bacteroidales bacterium]